MAVSVKEVRKVAVFTYGAQVKGYYVSILAAKPGGRAIEKKNVRNKGHATVSFPADFRGRCAITVRGSSSGRDEGTITV